MLKPEEIKICVVIIRQCRELCKQMRDWMLDYCNIEDKTNRSNVLMDFIRRCHCNLQTINLIYSTCLKNKISSIFFKLPVGILIRVYLTDCLYAFYLGSKNNAQAEKEIKVLNKDYVKSLQFRELIFEERLRASDVEYEEDIEHIIFSSSIEDTFPQYHKIVIDEEKEIFSIEMLSNAEIRGNENNHEIKLGKFISQLYDNERYSTVVKRLNAYYKYFSQYEHFSEHAHGDSLAPYEEDNVSFPLAIKVLDDALRIIHEDVTEQWKQKS